MPQNTFSSRNGIMGKTFFCGGNTYVVQTLSIMRPEFESGLK